MKTKLISFLRHESVKKISTYTIFGLLPILSGFFLTPAYTRFLTQEEYGKLSYFNILQGYFTLVVMLGLDNSLSRFFFEYASDNEKIKKMFSSILQFIFLLTFVLLLVIFILSKQIAFFENYFMHFIIIGNVLFTSVIAIFLNYYRDSQQLQNYITNSIIQFILLSAGSILGILFISKSAVGCFTGRCIGLAISFALLFISNLSFFTHRFNKSIFIKLFKFGIPFIPYSIIGIFYDTIDRIFIEKKYSYEMLGVYNIAFVLAFLINVIVNALMQTYNPKVFMQLENVEKHGLQVQSEIKKLRKNMFQFICICLLILSILCYPIILIFAGKSYSAAAIYIPILGTAFLLRLYYTVYSIPLFFYKKTFVLPIILTISTLGYLVCFYTIGYHLGLLGVALSVLFSRIIQIIVTKYLSAKYIPQNLDIYSGINHKIIIITSSISLMFSLMYYLIL